MFISHVVRGFVVAAFVAAGFWLVGFSPLVIIVAFVIAGNVGMVTSAAITAYLARRAAVPTPPEFAPATRGMKDVKR